MSKSAWADLESVEFEGGEAPRCKVRFAGREVSIYFNRPIKRSGIVRTLLEGTATRFQVRYQELAGQIADDLIDNFGDGRYLVWNQAKVAKCRRDWAVRMLRKALAALELVGTLERSEIEAILDELYIVGPILNG